MISKGNNCVTHLLFFSLVFEAKEGRIIFSSERVIVRSEAQAHAVPCSTRGRAGAFASK